MLCTCVCAHVCVPMIIWWHAPASTPLSPAAINTAGKTGRVRQTYLVKEGAAQPCGSGLDDEDDDHDGHEGDEDKNNDCFLYSFFYFSFISRHSFSLCHCFNGPVLSLVVKLSCLSCVTITGAPINRQLP